MMGGARGGTGAVSERAPSGPTARTAAQRSSSSLWAAELATGAVVRVGREECGPSWSPLHARFGSTVEVPTGTPEAQVDAPPPDSATGLVRA